MVGCNYYAKLQHELSYRSHPAARKSYTSLSCNSISTAAVCCASWSTQIERRTATNPRPLVHQPWKSLSVVAVANRAGCRRLSRDYPISDKWPFRCLAQDPVFRRLGLSVMQGLFVRCPGFLHPGNIDMCYTSILYFVNLCFCFGVPRSVR